GSWGIVHTQHFRGGARRTGGHGQRRWGRLTGTKQTTARHRIRRDWAFATVPRRRLGVTDQVGHSRFLWRRRGSDRLKPDDAVVAAGCRRASFRHEQKRPGDKAKPCPAVNQSAEPPRHGKPSSATRNSDL